MSLSVRPATVADVPALERIWVDAGRAAWAQILQPDTLAALTPPDPLRRALAEDGPLVLVVAELRVRRGRLPDRAHQPRSGLSAESIVIAP